MGDDDVPVCQTVGSHPVHNTRSQDLLGSPAANAEQKLDGSPIDERAGQDLKLADDFIDLTIPARFCRHKSSSLC